MCFCRSWACFWSPEWEGLPPGLSFSTLISMQAEIGAVSRGKGPRWVVSNSFAPMAPPQLAHMCWGKWRRVGHRAVSGEAKAPDQHLRMLFVCSQGEKLLV